MDAAPADAGGQSTRADAHVPTSDAGRAEDAAAFDSAVGHDAGADDAATPTDAATEHDGGQLVDGGFRLDASGPDATVNDAGCADGGCAPEPELECYVLRAHAGDKQTDYDVGVAHEADVDFHFAAPWTGAAYGIEITPLIDNKQVLFEWQLFLRSGSVQDGSISQSDGTYPEGKLIYPWAPGGTPLNLRELGDGQSGFAFPADSAFTLHVHYNSADPLARDASGARICVQKTAPAHLAGVAWLGTEAIMGDRARGVCRQQSLEPVQLLALMPHMHVKGANMRAVIDRDGGTAEVIHDGPFGFADQVWREVDHTLLPGDTVATTCDYTAYALFGSVTANEHCLLYTLHYPDGALSNGDSALHRENACLGSPLDNVE